MKIDLYTKIVLTIIAICLTFNILKDIEVITPAKAEVNSTVDVNIKSINNQTIYDGTIPVKIKQ